MADLECVECGDEIPDQSEAVYGQGGVKSDGAEKLSGGESVGADELFEFDDGPYCGLGCTIKGDTNE